MNAAPAAPRFTVTVGTFGDVHDVSVAGELDIGTAARLRDVLSGLTGRRIVVDVTALDFIDAAGLSALVLAHRRGAHARRLRVRGARGVVRRVFEYGGLGELLEDAAA